MQVHTGRRLDLSPTFFLFRKLDLFSNNSTGDYLLPTKHITTPAVVDILHNYVLRVNGKIV